MALAYSKLGGLGREEFPMKRQFRLRFTLPLLLVLAAACATSSKSAKEPEIAAITPEGETVGVAAAGNVATPKPGAQLICEYEETVGSHIPKRICRAKSDLEQTTQETQDLMRRLRANDRFPDQP
jgi:hypothetical protein